ncbi:NAD(P)-dependent oxidoreductase [Rhodobacteraceae bacterium LMO-12]|nr:NAD(P)-dependent oxidoreductase [Rhodobacteraceae bacterium LMO-JJ12]
MVEYKCSEFSNIGFIGLGAMGGGICANIIKKFKGDVFVFDKDEEALDLAIKVGGKRAESIADFSALDVVFLSLPKQEIVEEVFTSQNGFGRNSVKSQIVVDLGTGTPDLAKHLISFSKDRDLHFVDAPVARGTKAASEGTLLTMVGADPETFEKIQPLLNFLASKIIYCGPTGSGYSVKLINNMIMFSNVLALAEGVSLGDALGLDREILLRCLSEGSGNSYSVHKHGVLSMLRDDFPKGQFSVSSAMKDIGYALQAGEERDVTLSTAELTMQVMALAQDQGLGDAYFPAIFKTVSGRR